MDERTIREEMLLGRDAVEKLKNSHVAVFGLGGVGSWCCEGLARAGIGRLTLVDRDTVSLSNCNRQLCALTSTLGMEKTAVMAARARDINPAIEVRGICGHYEAADRASPSSRRSAQATSGTRRFSASTTSRRPTAAPSPA